MSIRWHTFKAHTPEARTLASAVFSQIHASQVVPPESKAMTYIDVHTEASGASNDDEGPVYRLFRNGVVDVGTWEPERAQPGPATVEFFVTMTVEASVGIGRTEPYNFHETMDALPGDDVESLYWRAWHALAKEHHFDAANSRVAAWNIIPNELPRPAGPQLI